MAKHLWKILWIPAIFAGITVLQIWVVDFSPSFEQGVVSGLAEYIRELVIDRSLLKAVLTLLIFFGIIFNRKLRAQQRKDKSDSPL